MGRLGSHQILLHLGAFKSYVDRDGLKSYCEYKITLHVVSIKVIVVCFAIHWTLSLAETTLVYRIDV